MTMRLDMKKLDVRYRYGGSAMFYRLNPKGGKLPGKIVVLTHDIAHR